MVRHGTAAAPATAARSGEGKRTLLSLPLLVLLLRLLRRERGEGAHLRILRQNAPYRRIVGHCPGFRTRGAPPRSAPETAADVERGAHPSPRAGKSGRPGRSCSRGRANCWWPST